MNIDVYDRGGRKDWDDFICRSKNSVFLFIRDYMDYHEDRFTDCSLIISEKGEIRAVMPAHRKGNTLHSHAGLTFGGLISDASMTTPLMMEIFRALVDFFHRQKIQRIIYKRVPYIYHTRPSDEDLYGLFRVDSCLVQRHLSSTLELDASSEFSSLRRRQVKKARNSGLKVRQNNDYETFMRMETRLLHEKYGVRPTHSAAEIKLLADRFPDNIKLFSAFQEEIPLGGVIMYENRAAAHAQYIGATVDGKNLGALDLIFDFLIHSHYPGQKRYFDFGISTVGTGKKLNSGLVRNKESFGAGAVTYDVYEWTVN